MGLPTATRERIRTLIESDDVVLFMKGNRDAPQCGFSSTVVQILDQLIPHYRTVDVLADPEVRDGIKEYASWPTIPQLYVRGEFVGGCDIIEESYAAHELHETLRVEPAAADSPEISISDDAAEQLRRAIAQAPEGSVLRFAVDARHRCRLFLAPGETGDVSATVGGVTLQMDPLSASRAGGARIDTVQSGKGVAFRVGLANSPFVAHPMTVKELASHLEADAALELFDVRPPNERATASIKKAIPMDAEQAQRVESLPRDTLLVFHCHHGQRSQVAAEHFASLGFTNAHNLLGGIEAWSLEIDASIPRY